MRDGFSAIDQRFEAIDPRFEAVDRRFGEVEDRFDTLRNELRAEIRQGDEETRRYLRVLHEDLVLRIALLQEGRRPPRKRKKR